MVVLVVVLSLKIGNQLFKYILLKTNGYQKNNYLINLIENKCVEINY